MNAKNYAYALLRAMKSTSNTDVDALIARFIATLKKRGVLKLLPKIYSEIQRLLEADKTQVATMTVAQEKDVEVMRTRAQEHLKQIGTSIDTIDVVIDDSLIGGYRLESNNNLFDESYRTKLLQLYRNIKSS